MSTKIFVIGIPSVSDVLDKVASVLEDAFDTTVTRKKECCWKPAKPAKTEWKPKCSPKWHKDVLDVPAFGHKPCCGTPPLKDVRFGYQGPAVDEPRAEDYWNRREFLDDHAAFDRFVEASEDCISRGLEKKSPAPIHRCNAIRKRVGEMPPQGIDLIGETDWWDDDCDW